MSRSKPGNPRTGSPLRVAVIGAGPSGLSTLKTLRAAGLDAVAYESGSRVGGQWAMDNPGGHAGAYASLRTNTNRAMSRFSDFEFPPDYPDYPGHAHMAAWFEAYAHQFNLMPHIRLSTPVHLVVGNDSAGYRVHTGESGAADSFDAVVIATGNLWDPVIPDFIQSFTGTWLHSHDYREPGRPLELKGRKVLVIGLGNSGCEIAVELSGSAKVSLSARSGQNILPRVAPGGRAPPHPADRHARPFTSLPRPLRDAAFRWLFPKIMQSLKNQLPSPEQFGLPPSPANPFLKRAVVNDHLFEALQQRRIQTRSGIARIEGRQVHFTDGYSDEVDAIVLATGYRFSLPYVDTSIIGDADPAQLALYQGIMHPKHTRFMLVGLLRALCSIWPYSEQQARWIAASLTGQFRLPDLERRQARAYPIFQGPLLNCQFRASDLRREAGLD